MDLSSIAQRIATELLDVPRVEQSPSMCGPAALSAVLAYFGVTATEDELRAASGATDAAGVEVQGVVRAAEQLGFDTWWTENAAIEQLEAALHDYQLPVMIEWFKKDGGHWSVITGIEDGNVYMMDPSDGQDTVMPLETFEHVWFDFSSDLPEPESMTNRLMLVIKPQE